MEIDIIVRFMDIERSSTGIDYESIAEAYGYKPVPDGYKPRPTVDVSIDWETGAEPRLAKQRDAMRHFDDFPLLQSHLDPLLKLAELDAGTIPTDHVDLIMTTQKWRYENGGEHLQLLLTGSGTGADIGEFYVARDGDLWDLYHRATSEFYRGKGVGSQMIAAIENCVQTIADETGQDQEIVMEAGQLPVLSLFLKNGYEVVEEDKQRFDEVMSKLRAGDPHYVLASCKADFRDDSWERKTWYVFEREVYERLGGDVWRINYEQPDDETRVPTARFFVEHGVRFKLRKRIEAKSADIVDESAGVREKVRHNLEVAPLFQVEVPANLRQTFLGLMEENGLNFLMADSPRLEQSLRARAGVELRPPLTSSEEDLFACLGEVASHLPKVPLTFRYTSSHEPGGVDRVMNSIPLGGISPNQSNAVGICVDGGHKIQDYLRIQLGALPPKDVFLFVYDLTKLRALSPDEKNADLNLKFYGMAAREGFTLREALVGVVHFASAH